MTSTIKTHLVQMRVLAVAVATVVAIAGLCGCSQEVDQPKDADFTGVRSVCELATLKCYYHNVATVNTDSTGPLADIFRTGYKRLWIEYSGTVDLGIDAGQVKIGKPNDQGVIKVFVPEVKILNVYLEEDSIAEPIVETGLFTNITAEEKMAGISAAQDDMRETAAQNQSLLTQAYDHSRRLIKGYVENVGQSIGEQYTVEWVDDSSSVS